MHTRYPSLLFCSLFLCTAGCGGPSSQRVPRGPCEAMVPPEPARTPGLAQYTAGPGKAVRVALPDLDGNGRADLLVQGKGYTSATGNVAAALYLQRGACGRYVGSLWTYGATRPRVLTARHHGLPVLQVGTRMTSWEHQTRYCFDGSVYVPMAERVRHFYDHRRKRLRPVALDSHWEAWVPKADDACRPLGAETRSKKTSARLAEKTRPSATESRRAALHVLELVLGLELRQKVNVKVGRGGFKLDSGWAMVHGRPAGAGGAPVDYSITDYQDDIDDGTFDEGVHALLRLDHDGRWSVVDHQLGCTDVCWEGWHRKHGAPAALFRN